MNISKNAVLFNNHQPLAFNLFRKYIIGTGYVALYDYLDGDCVLCRILDEKEISYYRTNLRRLILKVNREIEEHTVIVISCNYKLSEIEEVIKHLQIQHSDSLMNSNRRLLYENN